MRLRQRARRVVGLALVLSLFTGRPFHYYGRFATNRLAFLSFAMSEYAPAAADSPRGRAGPCFVAPLFTAEQFGFDQSVAAPEAHVARRQRGFAA
jgi:hypothetical protein